MEFVTGYYLHLIFRGLFAFCCEFRTVDKLLMWWYLIYWQLPYNDCGSFKMNSFMLNSHHDDPGIWIPVNSRRRFLYNIQHNIFHNLAISSNLSHRWPIVMRVIEVIPVHLINSYSKDRLKLWVDPLSDESFVKQFINVDCRSVSVVKYKRMPQRFRFGIEWFLFLNKWKQFLVNLISL